MAIDKTEFQDDLQAWFDDEIPKMVNSTVVAIKDIPLAIAHLPSFVQFMTVEELCQSIEKYL